MPTKTKMKQHYCRVDHLKKMKKKSNNNYFSQNVGHWELSLMLLEKMQIYTLAQESLLASASNIEGMHPPKLRTSTLRFIFFKYTFRIVG